MLQLSVTMSFLIKPRGRQSHKFSNCKKLFFVFFISESIQYVKLKKKSIKDSIKLSDFNLFLFYFIYVSIFTSLLTCICITLLGSGQIFVREANSKCRNGFRLVKKRLLQSFRMKYCLKDMINNLC